MAVPATRLAQWAREAELFVQVEFLRVEPARPNDGGGHDAPVAGRVVRVFAGDAASLGRQLTFTVPVRLPGHRPPPSATLWRSLDALKTSRFLEAALSRTSDGGLEVVAGMCTFLDAPSDAPAHDYRMAAEPAPSSPPRSRLGPVVGLAIAGAALVARWRADAVVRSAGAEAPPPATPSPPALPESAASSSRR